MQIVAFYPSDFFPETRFSAAILSHYEFGPSSRPHAFFTVWSSMTPTKKRFASFLEEIFFRHPKILRSLKGFGELY